MSPIDAHYRACAYSAGFTINQGGSGRERLMSSFDKSKSSPQWDQPRKIKKLLVIPKSFTKYAENCFTATEHNFLKYMNAFTFTKKVGSIVHLILDPFSNIDFFFEFLAMEIARNPQSIKILSRMIPKISSNIRVKSQEIITFIPRLSYSLENHLRWSYAIVTAGTASYPLICPDTIFVCSNNKLPHISYMIVPLSYTHCLIGVKDQQTVSMGYLKQFDAKLINYLSYCGSERYFIADRTAQNSDIDNIHNFAEIVKSCPQFNPKFSGWSFHPLIKVDKNSGAPINVKIVSL